MFRGRFAAAIAATGVVVCSVVAESIGRERHPLLDLITGCGLGLSGVLACTRGRGRLPGVLLVLAALTWFAVTIGAASEGNIREVAVRLSFVHRGLLIHAALAATVLCTVAGRRSFRVEFGVWMIIALGYVVAIDRDLATSTSWILVVGFATVTVLVGEAIGGRARWAFAAPAAIGMAAWASAASFLRDVGWTTIDTRFALYCCGLLLVSASIAALATDWLSMTGSVHSADIVRDGGREGLRFGFSTGDAVGFTDLSGEPFQVIDGESNAVFELANGLGPAIVAHRSVAIETSRLERDLAAALQLLAGYHEALQITRSRADEVAASEMRLRAADQMASAELEIELDRAVVARIMHAIELVADDRSTVGEHARDSLLEVLGEVEALAAGLAPDALEGGIGAALAALIAPHTSALHLEITEAPIDNRALLALYFAAAECVANAVRHASPAMIVVSLVEDDEAFVLTVSDDGCGGASFVPGHGLQGLQTRLAAMGGTVDVGALTSKVSDGTIVTIHLPRTTTSHVS